MSKPSELSGILRALGLPPPPGSLAELAVTHRSFAFEQPEPLPHNERLEFLGDAVLDLVVTDLIYRNYPEVAEGEMARLRASVVETHALAELARRAGLGEHIRLGRGEELSGGRDKDSLLADTLEAVIGAAYLERGMEAVRAVLDPIFTAMLEESVATGRGHDPKTALQELAVRAHGGRPTYRVASSGPDHDKRFVAHVYVEDELYGVGQGRSKKEAEKSAAQEALARLSEDGAGSVRAGDGAGQDGDGTVEEHDARAS